MGYSIDYIVDFTGGENSASSPDQLLPNQLRVCENVDLSSRGGFKRRTGIEQHSDLGSSRIDRLFEFEYSSGGVRVLKQLALTNNQLVDMSTGSVVQSGLDGHLDYEVYKNKLYFLSNSKYYVYDGSSCAEVTNANGDSNLSNIKKCRFVKQRGERFFAAGNPDDPNALYFSEIGDPTYWKVISVIQAITDDGDIITGLTEFHGSLLAFKSRYVYAWFGYDPENDVQFVRVNVHTGTRAYRTIQRVRDMLFYLGSDGIYSLRGLEVDYISSKKESKNIQPRVDKILHTSEYHLDTACAVYENGKYLLSIPTTNSAQCDTILVCFTDIADETSAVVYPWGVYTGLNINSFLNSLDGYLYSGSSNTDGLVHKHTEVYSDLGSGIDVYVETKPLGQTEQGGYIKNKKYRRGFAAMQQLSATNSTATITAVVDYVKVPSTLTADESMAWGRNWGLKWGFIDLVTRRFDIKRKGLRMAIVIEDATAGNSLSIYGFAVEYKIKKPNKE